MPERLLVHITRVADGVTRTFDQGVYPRTTKCGTEIPRQFAEYEWTEGNLACDCECAERMGDDDPDADPPFPCGSSAYDIRLEWLPVDPTG